MSVSRYYRTLLRLAQRARPAERSLWATIQIRSRFDSIRRLASPPTAELQAQWKQEADEAIKFLRLVAPSAAASASMVRNQAGVVRIAIDPLSGKVLSPQGDVSEMPSNSASEASFRNVRSLGSHVVRDQRVTSEQMDRHHRLLRRQHFLDRS